MRARQNGAADFAVNNGSLLGITSTPTSWLAAGQGIQAACGVLYR